MKTWIFAIALSIFTAGAAMAHGYKLGDLVIEHPWTRATPPGAKTGGGYTVIINNGKMDDRLVSATAEVSDKVQIHEMAVKDGVMSMRMLPEGVIIPAGGKIAFTPGAFHIMFLDLKTPLKEGTRIKGRLVFEHAGSIDVEYVVSPIGQTDPKHEHAMPM